eukprot:CAMPEP_0202393888 /NCGR_PEP_ID=MMETSP1127-20130417/93141_1 /ASSEMBLY_ACC=CAM_ASM_000462 /TAXON_ID=3047 /ORGANISM="Dunaliella tertiolecta, Strain CCMP1320" /LENGTH=123 /DNA_ID=CAMNT_0048996483 /DNA_START=1213 /DNA_END=1581 /DNA_ORIENTATION=+
MFCSECCPPACESTGVIAAASPLFPAPSNRAHVTPTPRHAGIIGCAAILAAHWCSSCTAIGAAGSCRIPRTRSLSNLHHTAAAASASHRVVSVCALHLLCRPPVRLCHRTFASAAAAASTAAA